MLGPKVITWAAFTVEDGKSIKKIFLLALSYLYRSKSALMSQTNLVPIYCISYLTYHTLNAMKQKLFHDENSHFFPIIGPKCKDF